MLPVAVDAMGGDNAPDAIVEGARRAVYELGVPVVLVGKPGEMGGPNGVVKFGPVTKPVGGEGAGWIKKRCNRFHCNPKTPCTAGIPPNEGFPADLVGLCAYIH